MRKAYIVSFDDGDLCFVDSKADDRYWAEGADEASVRSLLGKWLSKEAIDQVVAAHFNRDGARETAPRWLDGGQVTFAINWSDWAFNDRKQPLLPAADYLPGIAAFA
jgi:hypothetical protein